MYSYCSLSCPHKFPFMWVIRQNKHSWSKMPQSGRLSGTNCASWYQDEAMASCYSHLAFVAWLVLGKEGAEGFFTRQNLSKRNTNSFLMLNLFFYASAFLMTSKHPKLHAGWDGASDLNLNATTWVNCFAVSHTESGLNFPQVQQSNLRKQLSQTLDINLGCNSSTINEPQCGKKRQILLSQTRLRLRGLQNEKLPNSYKSKTKLHIWQKTKTHNPEQMPQFKMCQHLYFT